MSKKEQGLQILRHAKQRMHVKADIAVVRVELPGRDPIAEAVAAIDYALAVHFLNDRIAMLRAA